MDGVAQRRLRHLAKVKRIILAHLPCSVSEALAAGDLAGFGQRYARTGLWELIVERKA